MRPRGHRRRKAGPWANKWHILHANISFIALDTSVETIEADPAVSAANNGVLRRLTGNLHAARVDQAEFVIIMGDEIPSKPPVGAQPLPA